MKKKLWIMGIILGAAAVVLCAYSVFNHILPKAEQIESPAVEDIVSAVVICDNGDELQISNTELETVALYISTASPTRTMSVNNYPSSRPYYIVVLWTSETEYRYFVYEEENQIYVELPNEGIYKSDKQLFNTITSLDSIEYESTSNEKGQTTENENEDNNMETAQIEQENSYTQISVEEAVSMMENESDYIILDVRTAEEFAEKHIPNAINIPNETIGEEEITELPDKDQLILVYCRSGNRSKQASEKLAAQGYTNVYEFGGIIDWTGDTVSE